jgi:hypothetical protein
MAPLINDLHIVVIFGPVVTDEQHPYNPLDRVTNVGSVEEIPAN